MVLAIFAEMTSPTRSLRLPRLSTLFSTVSGISKFLGRLLRFLVPQFRNFRFDARDVAANRAQASRLLELAARVLQAQVKNFLAQVAALGRELLRRHVF